MQTPQQSASSIGTPEPLISSFIDDPIVAPLLPSFADLLASRVTSLKQALINRNWYDVVRLAHLIKGSASSYGYEEIAEAAGQVEDLGKSEQASDLLMAQLDVLVQTPARVYEGIRGLTLPS